MLFDLLQEAPPAEFAVDPQRLHFLIPLQLLQVLLLFEQKPFPHPAATLPVDSCPANCLTAVMPSLILLSLHHDSIMQLISTNQVAESQSTLKLILGYCKETIHILWIHNTNRHLTWPGLVLFGSKTGNERGIEGLSVLKPGKDQEYFLLMLPKWSSLE